MVWKVPDLRVVPRDLFEAC